MQKQEFEERIERTVTDEQYKVIEEVYMWHPSIRNTSGNLIFLDGTWSLDGSKIIDAWQKTEVL